jgi:2-polyprenyl-3-methyl-5-hydroxy-6-metoxy-1,4-benzoquinol methylase
MMLGLGEQFAYFGCAVCGCLQIAEFPADMERYYPPGYFRDTVRAGSLAIPAWAFTMIDVRQLVHRFGAQGAAKAAFGRALPKLLAQGALARYLPQLDPRQNPRILDVGCGTGGFLAALRSLGFAQGLGVDLYIDKPVRNADGVEVRKGTIHDLTEEGTPVWDVVMFHHSFEHMPDPIETLRSAANLLSPEGVCLIRIPIVPCYAWEHYGVDWVQWDAPRHFFLHSPKSLEMAAQQAGLRVQRYFCDSTPFQFVGSEAYRRGIPLQALTMSKVEGLTEANLHAFAEQTRRLNQEDRGDQTAFYLVKN